jgi:hypothetical protein
MPVEQKVVRQQAGKSLVLIVIGLGANSSIAGPGAILPNVDGGPPAIPAPWARSPQEHHIGEGRRR